MSDVNCTFPSISLLYKDQEGVLVKMDIIVPISYQCIPTIEKVVDVFKSKVDSLIENVLAFIEKEVENKYALKDLPKFEREPDNKNLDTDEEYKPESDDEFSDASETETPLPNIINIKKNSKLKKGKKDQFRKEICPDCGKFFDQKYLEKVHSYKCKNLPKPEEDNRFTCPDCGKVFSKYSYLQAHIKRLHSASNEEFMCHLCDFRSKNKYYLKVHIDAHIDTHEKRTWTCSKCGNSLGSKKTLENHMRAYHTEAGQNMVPCPHCGKEFKHYHIHNHINRVHKPKRFHCPHCSYKTITNFNLKLHVNKMHFGKKEMDKEECDQCGIKTTNLKYHKKIHHPF